MEAYFLEDIIIQTLPLAIGFDTEYELKDQHQQKFINELVSVQLAVQTITLVKVPLACASLRYRI